MIDLSLWTEQFLCSLHENFRDRVWFVGLQGSYGRGEATESSDIDIVVIFDDLMPTDLETYRHMLDQLPHRDLVCGFVSGKAELLNWEPADLFQFYFDTTPIVGSLDALLPLLDADAVSRAIRIGAGNIYHGCVHNMLHERSSEILKGLYKFASFVLQAVAYRQTGRYFRRQEELLLVLSEEDLAVARTYGCMKNGEPQDFDRMSRMLFRWAKRLIVD